MIEDSYERRRQAQLRKEIEEADQTWFRQQKLLDHLWQTKLDAETAWDDDQYFVGGFQEFHSKTPSFHKARRDRDWRVR